MLRLLHDEGASPLKDLRGEERKTVFSSLTMTVTRATYHRLRFDAIVDEARLRADSHPGHLVLDAIAKYVVYEALALLIAARTAVDEIAFIGARRAKMSLKDADNIRVTEVIRAGNGSPELQVIANNYRDWFEDVNEYRNALAHRGYSERLGIHSPSSPHPEAKDPEWNVLLVPDRPSVERPKRPHEWTYIEGRRLEDLVASTHHGLWCLVQELGTTIWGGSLPAPGSEAENLRQSGPMMLVVSRK